MTEVTQETSPEQSPQPGNPSNHGLEFRHLRYLVAVADAGMEARDVNRDALREGWDRQRQ